MFGVARWCHELLLAPRSETQGHLQLLVMLHSVGEATSSSSDSCTIRALTSVSTRRVFAKKLPDCEWTHGLQEALEKSSLPRSGRKVVWSLCQLLTQGSGGVLILVLDNKRPSAQLPVKPLDAAHLLGKVFKDEADNVLAKPLQFCKIINAFSSHSSSDRWERANLEKLAKTLGYSLLAPLVSPLSSSLPPSLSSLLLSPLFPFLHYSLPSPPFPLLPPPSPRPLIPSPSPSLPLPVLLLPPTIPLTPPYDHPVTGHLSYITCPV